MLKGWKKWYNHSTLATKIRFSYVFLLAPICLILFFSLYSLWSSNQQYEKMINSTVVASEFSLDFKKDFDYEVYLLIVGNKTVQESYTKDMLDKAYNIANCIIPIFVYVSFHCLHRYYILSFLRIRVLTLQHSHQFTISLDIFRL